MPVGGGGGGYTVSQFRTDKSFLDDAINQVVALGKTAGNKLYDWTIEADRTFYADVPSSTVTKILIIGREVKKFTVKKDTSSMKNALWISGSVGDGQQINGWFTDATSIATYGRIDNTLNLPCLTNVTEVTRVATCLLIRTAFPLNKCTIEVFPPRKDIDLWDRVQIRGFDDGSTFEENVVAIKYQYGSEGLTQTIELGASQPSMADVFVGAGKASAQRETSIDKQRYQQPTALGLTDTGTPDAIVTDLNKAPAALYTGFEATIVPGANNTGACTVNASSLGAVSIKLPDGTDPPADTLVAGAPVRVQYDGTNFVIQSVPAGGAITAKHASSHMPGGADILQVSATDKVLGRATAGAGSVEEISCTSAGRALLDDATAGDQRTTLGLGTIATQAANSVSITGGNVAGITDLAIADGGTGASTAQAAIDSLTNVAAATNEHVLTKDTATGNAIFKAGGSASPLTTKGDLYGYAAANARVPVGIDGQVLVADSTVANGVAWKTRNGFPFTFTSGDLVAGILTVTHNLGSIPVHVALHDQNRVQYRPLNVTSAADGNSVAINLTPFTITGTHRGTIGVGGDGSFDGTMAEQSSFPSASPGNIILVPITADGITAETVLALHFEGSNGSDTFIDSSPYVHTMAAATATISTAQYVFGASSGSFPGANYVSFGTSSDWAFGTGDFTNRVRSRLNSLPSSGSVQVFAGNMDSASTGWMWGIYNDSGTYRLLVQNGSDYLTSNALTLAINTWYDFEVDRASGTVYFFHDGVAKGSGDMSAVNFSSTVGINIGRRPLVGSYLYLDAYLDELLVCKGLALHTSGFTPNTTPYRAEALHLVMPDGSIYQVNMTRIG